MADNTAKKAVQLVYVKKYIDSLGLAIWSPEQVAGLLHGSEALLWRIENLANPNLDYETGKCANEKVNRETNYQFVMTCATALYDQTQRLLDEIYKPSFLSRWCK